MYADVRNMIKAVHNILGQPGGDGAADDTDDAGSEADEYSEQVE